MRPLRYTFLLSAVSRLVVPLGISMQPFVRGIGKGTQMDSPTQSAIQRVPVIDLNQDLDALVKELQEAGKGFGFFYVTNHYIPEAMISNIFEHSKRFFCLSETEKMAVYQQDPVVLNAGYRPLGSTDAEGKGVGDFTEAYTFKSEDHNGSGNQWPSQVPEMRTSVSDYYRETLRLAKTLYSLLGRVVAGDDAFFDDKTKANYHRLRIIHYPAPEEVKKGLGSHSDFGVFTVLCPEQDSVGLQFYLEEQGTWLDVPPMPGVLLINLGDQIARWTNGVLKSPKHRVISRPGMERYSIPVFFLADFDVVLEPLDQYISQDTPRLFAPQSAGEQLEARVDATGR
ncbi:hypothetical protein C8F01DRAFT_1367472 [Mycena amicta]|nr:hypothetical protein C8F01DRAFT_1367472 [Mycena amicta]